MKIHCVYPLLLRFGDAEHEADLGDLALRSGIVRLNGDVARLLQAQGLGGCDLLLAAADQALLQLDLEHLICHGVLPPQPRISFTVLPRFSATDSALTRPHRPAKVADTTLMGLLERIDLARMSLMPAASMTARTGPPAIMPVPGAAGLSSTAPAPYLPTISWGMVVPLVAILCIFFLAAASPLRMASGTSPALPMP